MLGGFDHLVKLCSTKLGGFDHFSEVGIALWLEDLIILIVTWRESNGNTKAMGKTQLTLNLSFIACRSLSFNCKIK